MRERDFVGSKRVFFAHLDTSQKSLLDI
jgi:hypothetical protein